MDLKGLSILGGFALTIATTAISYGRSTTRTEVTEEKVNALAAKVEKQAETTSSVISRVVALEVQYANIALSLGRIEGRLGTSVPSATTAGGTRR